jgi:hypothetical protein
MQHWDWVGNGEWPNAALRENRNAWNYDSSACPGNISSARSAKASCGVHDTIERRWRPTVAKLVYRPPDLRARCFVGSAHCPRSRVSGRGHPPCSPGRTASFRSPRPRTLLPCRNTTPAELQSSLMRLAIDAITQAEGAAPAAVAPPPPSAPATVATPATPLPTPPTQTQPPQPPPTPQQPAQPTQQPQIVAAPAPTSTPMPVDGQTPDGHDVNTSGAPPAQKNRNTAKAEAKLEKALEYPATLNTSATVKPDKWVVNASILASLTGCYRPAINTFIEARKQRIDELNASHGLGPGHNRATARTHPNAIPELVKRFKEEVLGQPF